MMPCDHYLAICNPLHYTAIMNQNIFAGLAALFWITGFAVTLVIIVLMLNFTFCGLNGAAESNFCSFISPHCDQFYGILVIMYVLPLASNSLNLNKFSPLAIELWSQWSMPSYTAWEKRRSRKLLTGSGVENQLCVNILGDCWDVVTNLTHKVYLI